MWVAVGHPLPQPNHFQQAEDLIIPEMLVPDAVGIEGLANDLTHREARVEGSVRVLENDLHVAAGPLELAGRQAADIAASD